MDKEVKLRIDEMVAAINAAPHLDIRSHVIDRCLDALIEEFNVDEGIIQDFIQEYSIDKDEITSFSQEAYNILNDYKQNHDKTKYEDCYDKLYDLIDLDNPVMAVAKFLVLTTIKENYEELGCTIYDSKEEFINVYYDEYCDWATEKFNCDNMKEGELEKLVREAVEEEAIYRMNRRGKVVIYSLSEFEDNIEWRITDKIEYQ